MRPVAVSLFVLLTVVAFRADASACSCMPEKPPCEAFGSASAVFIGRVTGAPKRVAYDTNEPLPPDSYGGMNAWPFAVEESFSGVSSDEVTVYSGSGGGDCGIAFKVGATYLVYAYENKGGFSTSICTRTRPLDAAAEDLLVLRNLPPEGTGGTLTGRVTEMAEDPVAGEQREVGPLAGFEVTVQGPDGLVRKATTDASGSYAISGLPTGDYTIRVALPSRFVSEYGERRFLLTDRGCAREDFLVVADGRISGRVLGYTWKEGTSRLAILLVSTDRMGTRYLGETHLIVLGDDGEFEFKLVSPGWYLVGLNLIASPNRYGPYPMTFYPGVSSRADATVIEVEQGAKVSGIDFELPNPLTPRTIRGIVVRPDGSPIGGASIELVDVDFPDRVVQTGRVHSDATGQFTIGGYEGYTYRVRASSGRGWSVLRSESNPLTLDKNVDGVRIVVRSNKR